MNSLLIMLWILSMIPLLLIPYSIALFYQGSFGRKTYSQLFIVSFFLLTISQFSDGHQSFPAGMLFYAVGGILLGLTCLRLDQVMTRRGK